MRRKLLRQLHGIVAGRVHPQVECAHAANEQKRLERPQDCADVLAHHLDAIPIGIRLAAGQSASQNIGMAVEIFGCGVHHDISAERQGLRQHGGGAGAVHRKPCPCRVGDGGDGLDIGDGPQRIGGRFCPDEFGLARPHSGLYFSQIGHINKVNDQAPVLAFRQQPVAQRPIHDLWRHHMIARRKREKTGNRRGHA